MTLSQLELEEESLLGDNAESGYKRRSQPPAPRWRNVLTFVLTAMVSGLVFYLIIFSFILSRPSLREKSKDYLFGTSKGHETANATEALANGPVDADFWNHYIPKPLPDHKSEDGLLDMSADELRAMLAGTNGYFARDWSVWLGWNNMRYILEGALMQAQLLNRTLILPSFVYARSCEFHNEVCAKYAKMVNKNDAFYSTEWSSWPIEKQMSWVIPMEMMIDVPRLRKTHKFMMLSEYFHLQGLNATRETTNGQWDRDYYNSGPNGPSLFIIPNHIYDPENIGRVDTFDFPGAPTGHNLTGDAIEYDKRLSQKAEGKKTGIISWKDARDAIMSIGGVLQDDAGLEAALSSANWLTMYTFEGDMGMDFTKTVIKPIRQVMRMSDARGWVEDYKGVTQEMVWLQGEVHLGRKSGLMRFTTAEARDAFSRIVLHDIQPPKRVLDLAAAVDKRLNNINKGRAWMAAHMRRGDFVTAGWTMESTIEKHFDRIQRRLGLGRKVLEELTPEKWEAYPVPDVTVNQELSHRPPPKKGDYIYLATDERSPDGLKYLQDHGALLFDNVVTDEDRREFGWGLLYTDIIALVEQQIIGHGSSYFYAHAMSSVAGGIVNFRAANGADRRSTLID